MIEIFHCLKFQEFINELEKTFSTGENGMKLLGIQPVPKKYSAKRPWKCLCLPYVYKSIALGNEL